MVGRKLAQYEIAGRLGAGGMGEVYQARDAKLGRNVAVKVLPDAFARDGERIARFEREAKLLASLNHPHIASLYGMEFFEEIHFLVMELVEGETLAERIAKGPIPADDALRIAQQIAEALEAAHEKGVVHRDLKPANVKLTPDDKVKVLDFGLAKAMSGHQGMENSPTNAVLSNSPTLSVMATNAGVVLGTAAYMSPEQARGEEVDHRSDIFSFGCVLFEMLTGRQTFQGKTIADIMASVLARDPDLQSLSSNLNPRVHHLLRRAIEKDSKRRWQTVADMRAEIEKIQADGVMANQGATTARKPLWKRAIPLVAGSLVISAIAGFIGWNLRPAARANVIRFPFVLPADQQFTNAGRLVVALSPDGTQMVYVANNRLYLRNMSELESRPIPGTEIGAAGVLNPVFSPDGGSIAFWSQTDLAIKRIAVTGGAAVTLCAAISPSGMSWYKDSVLFGQPAGIMKVSANGGKPEVLIAMKDAVGDTPQMLPDGENLLFTFSARTGGVKTAKDWDQAQIVVQSLKTGARKTLIEGGSAARYISTGHIVYAFAGTLRAVPFDVKRLEVRGGAVPVIEGVLRAPSAQTGVAHFSISDNGTLVYVPGAVAPGDGGTEVLAFADRAGKIEPLKLPAGSYAYPRLSPDGKQLTFNTTEGNGATVWVYDLSGGTSMRKLTLGGSNLFPMWSGDGERIVYQSDREGDRGLFWQRADGTGAAERLTKPETDTAHIPGSWPPKSKVFSFSANKPGDSHIWMFSIDSKQSTRLSMGTGTQGRSAISPDGHWVAYQSTELGQSTPMGNNEVFVQPYPGAGVKYQITRTGANNPLWSPDGKELFYSGPASKLMAVTIKTQPFAFSDPVELPMPRFIQIGPASHRNFDITPDGKRFIMVFAARQTQPEGRPSAELRVVLNWLEELKQRVPLKN